MWNGLVGKIINCLDKSDIKLAQMIFLDEYCELLKGISNDEKMAGRMFSPWLLLRFCKENMPVADWFIKRHGSQISQREREILTAAKEHYFGIFRVEEQTDGYIKLMNVAGKEFIVETTDLPKIEIGVAAFAQIVKKEDGNYFMPGVIGPLPDDDIFQSSKKITQFHESWNGFLEGFFNYLAKERGLNEKTADKHTENVDLFLTFVEHETSITSFEDVTRSMIKTEFKKFVRRHIFNKVDLDKVYCSLHRFFKYLAEEKQVKNPKILQFLSQR